MSHLKMLQVIIVATNIFLVVEIDPTLSRTLRWCYGPRSKLFMHGSLLEKRFIVTAAIHFWYELITVADTKNELLFFVSADLINRYKNTIFHIGWRNQPLQKMSFYFLYRLT
jgi:hypothetical protein